MRRPRFSIASGPGDFMPLLIGSVILFVSLPGFILMLLDTEFTGILGGPVTVMLGLGVLLGLAFVVAGIQACSEPGSLIYRISHGRIFKR